MYNSSYTGAVYIIRDDSLVVEPISVYDSSYIHGQCIL